MEISDTHVNRYLKLIFGYGNAKLKGIVTFSLPAGHACPMAKLCLSKVDPDTGKLADGKHTQFRCFSASTESIFPKARELRWNNFNALRQGNMVETLQYGIDGIKWKKGYKRIIRIHVSGDFFSQAYFDAWVTIANQNTGILFYAYTKALSYWVKRLDSIPDNFKLTASQGGTQDNLIEQYGLKSAKVVFSLKEAKGLKIDHDDSLAYGQDKSFALILHGVQPAGSPAAKALSAMKAQGVKGTGYNRKGN